MRKTNCFSFWSDILAFGNAFENDEWKFKNSSNKNILHLTLLDALLNESMVEGEKALVLNDGICRIYDFVFPTRNKRVPNPFLFIRWLNSLVYFHQISSELLKEYDSPGLRSVISFGERINVSKEFKKAPEVNRFYTNTKFSEKQNTEIVLYNPLEFQLNLAFSKAYFIESMGRKANITGCNFYFDSLVLDIYKKYFNGLSVSYKENKYNLNRVYENAFGFNMENTQFRIEESFMDDNYIIKLIADENKNTSKTIQEFYFSTDVIPFSFRGLNTTIYKLLKYRIGNKIENKNESNIDSMLSEWIHF